MFQVKHWLTQPSYPCLHRTTRRFSRMDGGEDFQKFSLACGAGGYELISCCEGNSRTRRFLQFVDTTSRHPEARITLGEEPTILCSRRMSISGLLHFRRSASPKLPRPAQSEIGVNALWQRRRAAIHPYQRKKYEADRCQKSATRSTTNGEKGTLCQSGYCPGENTAQCSFQETDNWIWGRCLSR